MSQKYISSIDWLSSIIMEVIKIPFQNIEGHLLRLLPLNYSFYSGEDVFGISYTFFKENE